MKMVDLNHLVDLFPPHSEGYFRFVLERIGGMARDYGYDFFIPEEDKKFAIPGKRIPYVIKAQRLIVAGIVLTPDPKRSHTEKAWNRIEESLRKRIKSLEKDGWEGLPIRTVLLQVWERERDVVILPLTTLEKSLPSFRKRGDFTVKKDCGNYVLQTPRSDDNIRLDVGLENLFEYFC